MRNRAFFLKFHYVKFWRKYWGRYVVELSIPPLDYAIFLILRNDLCKARSIVWHWLMLIMLNLCIDYLSLIIDLCIMFDLCIDYQHIYWFIKNVMWTDFWMTHRLESNIRKAIPAPLSSDPWHFMTPKLYDSPSPFRPAPTYNGVSTLSPQTTYDVR